MTSLSYDLSSTTAICICIGDVATAELPNHVVC